MLELVGSVVIPKRFRNLSLDEIIAQAKQEYFKERWLKKEKSKKIAKPLIKNLPRGFLPCKIRVS